MVPNLNLLGTREPEIYGSDTLDDVAMMLEDRAAELGLRIDMRQSNHEGHLIDWLHEAGSRGVRAVILNAGALTHTSVGLHDAIKAHRDAGDRGAYLQPPASPARRSCRQGQLCQPGCAAGVIVGFGIDGLPAGAGRRRDVLTDRHFQFRGQDGRQP